MAGIDKGQLSCGQNQYSNPGRDKHTVFIVVAQAVIDFLHDLLQWSIGGHMTADQSAGHHHKQSGRDSLS